MQVDARFIWYKQYGEPLWIDLQFLFAPESPLPPRPSIDIPESSSRVPKLEPEYVSEEEPTPEDDEDYYAGPDDCGLDYDSDLYPSPRDQFHCRRSP